MPSSFLRDAINLYSKARFEHYRIHRVWNSRKRRNNLEGTICRNLSARCLRARRRLFWSERSV